MGPNRDRTGTELFSVPPMGRQTLALCNDSSSWRDLHVGPNAEPKFLGSRLCGRMSLSGQRPTNKVRSHMWGCIPGTGPNKARSHIGGGRCSRGCLQHHRRLPQHHFEAYVLARHTCCEPCLLARYNSRRGKLPGETSPLARHISWQGIPPRDSLSWPDMPPVRNNSKNQHNSC